MFYLHLFFPRWSRIPWHFASKSLEERNQICAVLCGKVEGLYVLVEIGIGVAASSVEINHVMEGFQAAVMHVRGAQGDVAQGGCLELSLVRLYFCLPKAAEVGELTLSIHPRAGVVKLSVGKQGVVVVDGMADGTIAPVGVFKNRQAANGRRRERLLVAALLVFVKRRVAAEQSAFEARQRLLNEAEGDGSRPKRLGKLGLIRWIMTDLGHKNIVSLIHLQRVRNREA